MKVLILGAYGMLGSSLSTYLKERNHTVFCQGRMPSSEFFVKTITKKSLQHIFNDSRIDVVINLIAATDVDLCEKDYKYAYNSNVKVCEEIVLAIQASEKKPYLIHISTDHVYNGSGYQLEQDCKPSNVYAKTKLEGEYSFLKIDATILRTNFFGLSQSKLKKSFTDWILESLMLNREITVFDDILISALHIKTLCQVIDLTAVKRIPGIYNIGCVDGASKAWIAEKIASNLKFSKHRMKIGISDTHKFFAARPKDMRMNSQKFSKTFNFILPTIESQVNLAVEEYKFDQ